MTEEKAPRPLPSTETKGEALNSVTKSVQPMEAGETQAQTNANLAKKEEIDQAEQSAETADRAGQIEMFIFQNELLNNEDVFGDKPLNNETMAIAVQLLLDVENKARQAKPDFDITEVWNGETAKKYLERKYAGQEKDNVNDGKVDKGNAYERAIKSVREQNPNVDNLKLADALLNKSYTDESGELKKYIDSVPPTEIAKLQSFVRIQELAATPEDAAIVTAKINSLNFDNGIPNPVLFVETQILSDESLSESYRDSVAEQFKLPNPRVKTGGQVNQTLDARDPDGKPLYTRENPVKISADTQAFEKPDGSRAVLVDTGDGRPREIPWERNGDSDDVIGTKISLAKIWAQNEWGGQTDFFGESIDIENDILSQTDPQKLTKVRNTISTIFGGTRGYDGVIIQDNEAAFIGWFNQYLATKSDAAIGDFDKDAAMTNRVNLGLHPNGDSSIIDYDVLRAAALYAKGEYGMGEPNYYALQKHLHEIFPEKDIPLTGENAPKETSEDS